MKGGDQRRFTAWKYYTGIRRVIIIAFPHMGKQSQSLFSFNELLISVFDSIWNAKKTKVYVIDILASTFNWWGIGESYVY